MFWQLLAVMMRLAAGVQAVPLPGWSPLRRLASTSMSSGSRASILVCRAADVLGAVAGDEPVPPCCCLLFVLGGLVPGLVAGLPPAQGFGPVHGAGWCW
jgi:hypothetical protein